MGRVYINEVGDLLLGEGDYGQDSKGIWYVRPPGGHAGGIPDHTIEEHEDGTITVTPSIVLSHPDKSWHGYLIKGEWK